MRILVFRDGSAREITGELGKYWLTGEDRVRKLSKQIAEIREVPEPVEVKPKKKSTRKKKESTEEKCDGKRGE